MLLHIGSSCKWGPELWSGCVPQLLFEAIPIPRPSKVLPQPEDTLIHCPKQAESEGVHSLCSRLPNPTEGILFPSSSRGGQLEDAFIILCPSKPQPEGICPCPSKPPQPEETHIVCASKPGDVLILCPSKPQPEGICPCPSKTPLP